MFDVLGIGIATVDDFVRVPEFAAPDTKVRVLESARTCGGLCANALVAAARLGARAAFAGVLGTDDRTDLVVAALEGEGIDTSRAVRLPDAGPGRSLIVVDGSGRRVVYSEPGRTVLAGDVLAPPELVRSSRVLLVDHVRLPASIAAARVAAHAGIPVVGDLERDDDPRFGELLALVDHLVISLAFGRRLTGAAGPAAVIDELRAPGRTVVVTAGSAGAWSIGPGPDDAIAHRPAFEVPVVDTTGCGDAFHGAYAAGLAFGLDLPSRMRLATAVAGLAATRLGGQAGLPGRAAVGAFLAAHPD